MPKIVKEFTRYIDKDFDELGIKTGYQFVCEYDDEDGREPSSFDFKIYFINESKDREITVTDNEPRFYGYLKWDGCMNLIDGTHLCGRVHLDHYIENLRFIYYVIADQILGKS